MICGLKLIQIPSRCGTFPKPSAVRNIPSSGKPINKEFECYYVFRSCFGVFPYIRDPLAIVCQSVEGCTVC